VIAAAAVTAAAGAAVFAVSPPLPALFVAASLFGLAIGTATTAVYTRAGETIPADVRGSGFGVLSSASLVGLAVSPVAAGAAAGWSLPGIFAADAVIALAIAWAFGRRRA
jgi:MFS family permease